MGKSVAFVCGGIGDQLYHFTQMQALAQLDHRSQIDIACLHPRIMSEITKDCEWAGQIIDLSAGRHLSQLRAFGAFVRQLAGQRYSHAYILHKSSSFKLACLLAGITHRIGLSSNFADNLILSHPLSIASGGARRAAWGHRPFIASIDDYLEAKFDAGQYQKLSQNTPIMPSKACIKQQQKRYQHLPRPYIISNLFAQDETRRWSVGHALQCFEQILSQQGGTIFLNAGADAADWHRQLIQQWSGKTGHIIHSFDDYSDIRQDIALYHLADLYLGVDSFTANLALNCDLKSVTLFSKKSDILTYRSESRPVYPDAGQAISNLPVSRICDEVALLLKTPI